MILLVALISFASPLYHCSMISLAVALCHRISILIFFSIHFHKTNGKHAESSQHEILLLLTFVFYHHFFKIIVLCVPGGKNGAIPFKPFDRTCLYLYIYYICHSLAGQFVKDASAVCIFLPLREKSCCCWIGMLRFYIYTVVFTSYL